MPGQLMLNSLLFSRSLLVWLLVLPLVGALVGAFIRDRRTARWWALSVSLATLLPAVGLIAFFDYSPPRTGAMQFIVSPPSLHMDEIGFSVSLGVDGVSLWLVVLTALLVPLAIGASWESIRERAGQYYTWMLLLEFAMLGVFASKDLLLFYMFFELTLIPMFFIIGIWGGGQRQAAAAKFFLFTFSASVLTLAGVIYLGLVARSFDVESIVAAARMAITPQARFWVFLSLLVGFAVKVPLFPLHTWLPLAHTEAPTAGSVILAGVLLKLGTYGLYRFALPVGLPGVTPGLATFIGTLCLVGIIYGALVAWVQQDIKKLVAYSSVSHLGFCVLGLASLTVIGIEGSVLYMVNHGINTGALFLCVGMIYDRYHTRDIRQLSGLARRMPKLAFFLVLFTLASIGLPGTNGFVSEFLTILGAFTSPHLGIGFGAVASLGIILGAVYMLHMVACVLFGPLKTPVDTEHGHQAHGELAAEHSAPGDIGKREIAVLTPLAVLVILLGVMPNLILNTVQTPATNLVEQVNSNTTPTAPRPRPAGYVMNLK
jgi:NADH-quinone oxidoreductase subunit M